MKNQYRPYGSPDLAALPRCGAKTRAGVPCKQPACARNGRCHWHGGKSTGPRTTEGKARVGQAHYKHGRYTRAAMAQRKAFAQLFREVRALLGKRK